ncbi:Lrp/AsnC family transcriptional regulator, partial [Luteibacter sp.]|uniref:Lrp/AsnC family transcriptional regulator n=1 Tax=Luteibacter sp. TaxID=1886636 RepID=UPI003F7F4FA4
MQGTLDRTDLKILATLQANGRISNAELAAEVNLSPSACLRRVQRLEGDGIIAGYGARLEPRAIGLGLQAFVRVQLS